MNTILKNIVQFVGLVVGVPVALPHRLNVNGVLVAPQLVFPQQGGCTVTADAVNIIVTRQVGGPASLDVYAEFWHTIESVTPLPGKLAGLTPFIFQPGPSTASGGSDNPFGFPEMWAGDVAGEQIALAVPAAVSDGSTNDSVRAIRAGSLVGFLVRLDATGVPDNGTYTMRATINGIATSLVIVCTALSNKFGGFVTQAPGIDNYVAGDAIGVTAQAVNGDEEGITIISSWIEAFEVLP